MEAMLLMIACSASMYRLQPVRYCVQWRPENGSSQKVQQPLREVDAFLVAIDVYNQWPFPRKARFLLHRLLQMQKNKQYQSLAMAAERVVPKTWWRDGFASDLLLLSHNDSDLPRKLFDAGRLRNKKLKNILQCVTRQQFIRRSFSFETPEILVDSASTESSKCTAMSESVVKSFFELWQGGAGEVIGGEWRPNDKNNGQLLVSALEVLDHFYANYGGIWTGCFKMEKSSPCRGALAASAYVAATHMIYDFSKKQKEFSESAFTAGYMLASLGRGLLHGDTGTTGSIPLTTWKVKLADFVALQAAYLNLYVKSFGAVYNDQLSKYVPMAFPPTFKVHSKENWRSYSQSLEPVYTSLRNWMFTEASSLIDFGPYVPLVAFPEVRAQVTAAQKRRVLIDVGANGFFASPKYLLDSYAPFLPFTHAIMIEPEPHFSATVPPAYTTRYNITFLPIYAEVATGTAVDMIKLLPSLVSKDDFVVLKFDVDPNRYAQGPTMEWGFLFSIMQEPKIAELVDELYIELHFNFPSLFWKHYHSNWEALDAFRYLRAHGAIVHSWP